MFSFLLMRMFAIEVPIKAEKDIPVICFSQDCDTTFLCIPTETFGSIAVLS